MIPSSESIGLPSQVIGRCPTIAVVEIAGLRRHCPRKIDLKTLNRLNFFKSREAVSASSVPSSIISRDAADAKALTSSRETQFELSLRNRDIIDIQTVNIDVSRVTGVTGPSDRLSSFTPYCALRLNLTSLWACIRRCSTHLCTRTAAGRLNR